MLVSRGYFDSRTMARAAIEAGRVMADGTVVARASDLIAPDAEIASQAAHPFVSRGGVKLAHGLDAFGMDPAGRACLDLGASTGGFTDVLLQRGAASVLAIDVGHRQLHPSLRSDPRVTARDGFDVRDLTAGDLPEGLSLIVADLSFISLAKALGRPLALAAPETVLAALFKPQFEVGRAHVGKGGIVTDEAATSQARDRFAGWLDTQGWTLSGWTPSPIAGGSGNAEWLFNACKRT